MRWAPGDDLTSQYKSFEQGTVDWRPIASTAYLPGSALQIGSQTQQVYPDAKTAVLTGTAANQFGLLGVVDTNWTGFDGAGNNPASYTTPSSVIPANPSGARGSLLVPCISYGYAPGVLVDQSGSGAVTLVDKLSLIASRATAGYLQGGSASAPAGGSAVVGGAMLPTSGIGSSITAAALAEAAQTATVATPAAGDTLVLTIQAPYIDSAPGVAQTYPYSLLLNSTSATSATTAAAAMVAYLNGQANFSKYFIATNAAGVITVTVNTASATFYVNGGVGTSVEWGFKISISGMVANSLTFACSVVGGGGTTFTAGGANFAAGTGFIGYVPAFIQRV